METPTKQQKGLALLSAERRREIGSIGGKTAQRMGTAHRWTSEEAQEAGRKGGKKSRRRKKQPQSA